MVRHRIRFRYNGAEDDNAIQLVIDIFHKDLSSHYHFICKLMLILLLKAFSKKMVDQRKEWLTTGMEERKRRRELGLPEVKLECYSLIYIIVYIS